MIIEGFESVLVTSFSYTGVKYLSSRVWPGFIRMEPIVKLYDPSQKVAAELLYRSHGPWRSMPIMDRNRCYLWYRHIIKKLPLLLEKEPLITINLSTHQAADSKLIQLFIEFEMIDKIMIEWIEDTYHKKEENHKAVINFKRLVDKGARIAIDDAGSGHDWIERMRQVPTDLVKLDGQLFQEGFDNAGGIADVACRGIVEMCSTLNKPVVAEWIETEKHMEYAMDIGCQMGQGWYFGN